MSKVNNFVCDGCLEILYGKDRGAFIDKENYFTFKGGVAIQAKDEESAARYHFFIGRHDAEWAFHLNKPCFTEWMEREITLYHNRRKAQLMDEVNNAGGSAYVPRPTPGRYDHKRPAEAPKL